MGRWFYACFEELIKELDASTATTVWRKSDRSSQMWLPRTWTRDKMRYKGNTVYLCGNNTVAEYLCPIQRQVFRSISYCSKLRQMVPPSKPITVDFGARQITIKDPQRRPEAWPLWNINLYYHHDAGGQLLDGCLNPPWRAFSRQGIKCCGV